MGPRRIAEMLKQMQAATQANQALQTQLSEVSTKGAQAVEAHGSERQRAEDLQANLLTAQSAHEHLFARYAATVEENDTVKGELKRVAEEKEDLSKKLREEQQAKQDLADAGPQQLSVSDVLISINFEGVPLALDVRPWDTNFDDVVKKWLAAANRSLKLQESIVKYLRHLENSATAFPLRVEAKLLEVHEQFAV